MKKVIIFDGDDTLWPIQYKYELVKFKFAELAQVDPSWIKWLDNLDSERVATKKFSRARFLETLLITYAYICGARNIHYDVNIEKQIRELEETIFGKMELFPDTMEVLKELSQNFDLVLFTSGDDDLQWQKLRILGDEFIGLFKRIHCVEIKNEEEYAKLFALLEVPLDYISVVGNSMKTDINPVLKFGVNKIFYIPRGTWKYIVDQPQSNKFITVNSLTEIKNYLLGGEK